MAYHGRMHLRLAASDFLTECAHYEMPERLYRSQGDAPYRVIAFSADRGLVLETTDVTQSQIEQWEDEGYQIIAADWSTGGAGPDSMESATAVYVAAVAYQSSERKPGLWMDAFAEAPSTGDVLSALYEEFRENGDIGDLSLEAFLKIARPNVVIMSPDQLRIFARRNAPYADQQMQNPEFAEDEPGEWLFEAADAASKD